jgi:hypothetical protein
MGFGRVARSAAIAREPRIVLSEGPSKTIPDALVVVAGDPHELGYDTWVTSPSRSSESRLEPLGTLWTPGVSSHSATHVLVVAP